MTLEGITPGDPKRVFEALRARLTVGDTDQLLNNSSGNRVFQNCLFDLSGNSERFFVVAGARFNRCTMLTRADQLLLIVDDRRKEIPLNRDDLTILGGGQAVPRVIFSTLKNCAAEDDRLLETTQTIDFGTLRYSRVYLRKLLAVGDVVVGSGQTLVVDERNCIFLGDVILNHGARIEGSAKALNWPSLRGRAQPDCDFERRLVFPENGEPESLMVVPRTLDFREGFPNEIMISDAVVAGDIRLRADQTLIIRPSIQRGRRASVLLRGRILCDRGSPRIIGGSDIGFHGLGRAMASLAPIILPSNGNGSGTGCVG